MTAGATVSRRRANGIVAVLSLVTLAATVVFAGLDADGGSDDGSDGWAAGQALALARATGWVALAALFAALLATPLGRVLARLQPGGEWTRTVRPFRRAAGLASASLAFVHASVSAFGWLDGAWEAVLSWPHLRAGALALLVLLALALTSFPRVVTALRVRLWKPLHRLAYVAAALVLLHLVLSPFAPRTTTLWLFGGLLVLGVGRLIPSPSRNDESSAPRVR